MTLSGDQRNAERHFKNALKSNASNKMTHANLGEIYKSQKKFSDGLEEFSRAITLDPNYVNGYNEMAMVYLAMAKDAREKGESPDELLGQASEGHQKAISLIPDFQNRHRGKVRMRFAQALESYGFDQEAQRMTLLGEEDLRLAVGSKE